MLVFITLLYKWGIYTHLYYWHLFLLSCILRVYSIVSGGKTGMTDTDGWELQEKLLTYYS